MKNYIAIASNGTRERKEILDNFEELQEFMNRMQKRGFLTVKITTNFWYKGVVQKSTYSFNGEEWEKVYKNDPKIVKVPIGKRILEINQVKQNTKYLLFDSQFGTIVEVKSLGNNGYGNKIYLTRFNSSETNETMIEKFNQNKMPDCFVCWDFMLQMNYHLIETKEQLCTQ